MYKYDKKWYYTIKKCESEESGGWKKEPEKKPEPKPAEKTESAEGEQENKKPRRRPNYRRHRKNKPSGEG